MIPPTSKRFDVFPPLTGGCSEGLDVFRFFCKLVHTADYTLTHSVYSVQSSSYDLTFRCCSRQRWPARARRKVSGKSAMELGKGEKTHADISRVVLT